MTTDAQFQKAMTGLRVPAEWEPHDACWLAYPHLESEWLDHLEAARREVIALCRAIGDSERVELLVPFQDVPDHLQDALAGSRVRFHSIPYGDIWTRDTGPVFTERSGRLRASCFEFNGWGERFLFEGDAELGEVIAGLAGAGIDRVELVAEGGSIESDGRGTAISTRQCLLNENRNPTSTERDVERVLASSLGIERLLWLERGLINDHTDGHVDTLARFVAPKTVACAVPAAGDPNAEILDEIRRTLTGYRRSSRLTDVLEVPSPGAITDSGGELLAASYLNFYIANRCVIVPTYGVANDDDAVSAIGAMFPDREAIGLSARAIATGGGAIHCITKQQPRLESCPE